MCCSIFWRERCLGKAYQVDLRTKNTMRLKRRRWKHHWKNFARVFQQNLKSSWSIAVRSSLNKSRTTSNVSVGLKHVSHETNLMVKFLISPGSKTDSTRTRRLSRLSYSAFYKKSRRRTTKLTNSRKPIQMDWKMPRSETLKLKEVQNLKAMRSKCSNNEELAPT